jgi:hypothetical protein
MSLSILFALGLMAGSVTTLAGAGGGLLLLLALSAMLGPAAALAVSSPALFFGNLHRAVLFRRSVSWGHARAFAVGAFPGAVAGALVTALIPPRWIQALLVGATLLSIARAVGWLRFGTRPSWITPAGAVIGTLTGSGGGAGTLAAPLFLSMGLAGEAYVGTTAVSGVAMHLGRLAGYGLGGLLTAERIALGLFVAVAVLVGNAMGRRLRRFTERWPSGLLEHFVLVGCVLLTLSGLRPGGPHRATREDGSARPRPIVMQR